jgi:hypothetical protein
MIREIKKISLKQMRQKVTISDMSTFEVFQTILNQLLKTKT